MTDPRLTALGELGGYFRLETHPGTGNAGPPGTEMSGGAARVSVAALLADPVHTAAHVEATRLALGGAHDQTRVAASVTHLGLVARVVSPFLALAGVYGVDAVPTLAELHTLDGLRGSPIPLSVPASLLDTDQLGGRLGQGWADELVDRLIMPLDRAFAADCTSARTRAGNAASAVNGATTVLLAHVSGAAAEGTRAAARRLLAHSHLAAATTGTPGTPTFRRRSCCWLYRLTPRSAAVGPGAAAQPPAGICFDCILSGVGDESNG